MHVATFSIWLSGQRLLIDFCQPDEEFGERPKRIGVTTDEYTSTAFGDFQIALNSWATNHFVFPDITSTVRHY
jgi:hypothetical protein